jgi:hypothetical protein
MLKLIATITECRAPTPQASERGKGKKEKENNTETSYCHWQ